MAKKYYAIRCGKVTGIYNTWSECKSLVTGVSGAEYKGFETLEEAQIYMSGAVSAVADSEDIENDHYVHLSDKLGKNNIIAYVDGSYNAVTKEFSYGMVILHAGKELCFSEKIDMPELGEMRNVAGEIKGAEAAMRYAVEHNCEKVAIYHDYEGVAKWCTGAWQAKKEGTKAYKSYFDSVKDKVSIEFVKVKAHSNIKYNEMADQLAKKAIF